MRSRIAEKIWKIILVLASTLFPCCPGDLLSRYVCCLVSWYWFKVYICAIACYSGGLESFALKWSFVLIYFSLTSCGWENYPVMSTVLKSVYGRNFATYFVLAISFKLLTILKFVCTITKRRWHRKCPVFKPWVVWFCYWMNSGTVNEKKNCVPLEIKKFFFII